jgi:hypothetical protein
MAIFFESKSRGEDSNVLSICGTKDDFAQLANDLKVRLALQDVYTKPESNLRIPNLKSASFDGIECIVVSDEKAAKLDRSVHRKKALILAVWLLIVTAIICALIFTPKIG